MTTYRSPRLLPYALIVSGGIILSLAAGRPEPLLLSLPFLVVLALSVVAHRTRPDIDLRVSMDRAKAVEGDEVEIVLDVTTRKGRFEVGFVMQLPAGLDLLDPPESGIVAVGSPASLRARVRCRRWGVHAIGGGIIQARDLVSAFVHEQAVRPSLELRVYPRPERLRSVLRPHLVRPRFGSFVSRVAGAGLEFADIREFTAGDERRHINWRATARHRQLHVNLFHPERSADIVLLVDTFTDVNGENFSSLDVAVRAATSVAIACLQRRDRVGLLSVGGTLRWLLPGMGTRQLYRIVDSLMQTQLAFNYTWPKVETIPQRVLPPGAVVIALTPLADRRTPVILLDLHGRGHDIAVIEIDASSLLPEPITDSERLARRLWALYREAVRHHYRQVGIPISAWDPARPLELPLAELQRFRRTSRRVHA